MSALAHVSCSRKSDSRRGTRNSKNRLPVSEVPAAMFKIGHLSEKLQHGCRNRGFATDNLNRSTMTLWTYSRFPKLFSLKASHRVMILAFLGLLLVSTHSMKTEAARTSPSPTSDEKHDAQAEADASSNTLDLYSKTGFPPRKRTARPGALKSFLNLFRGKSIIGESAKPSFLRFLFTSKTLYACILAILIIGVSCFFDGEGSDYVNGMLIAAASCFVVGAIAFSIPQYRRYKECDNIEDWHSKRDTVFQKKGLDGLEAWLRILVPIILCISIAVAGICMAYTAGQLFDTWSIMGVGILIGVAGIGIGGYQAHLFWNYQLQGEDSDGSEQKLDVTKDTAAPATEQEEAKKHEILWRGKGYSRFFFFGKSWTFWSCILVIILLVAVVPNISFGDGNNAANDDGGMSGFWRSLINACGGLFLGSAVLFGAYNFYIYNNDFATEDTTGYEEWQKSIHKKTTTVASMGFSAFVLFVVTVGVLVYVSTTSDLGEISGTKLQQVVCACTLLIASTLYSGYKFMDGMDSLGELQEAKSSEPIILNPAQHENVSSQRRRVDDVTPIGSLEDGEKPASKEINGRRRLVTLDGLLSQVCEA